MHIPASYHVIQMAYRLVSYLNLTIFITAAALLGILIKNRASNTLDHSKVLLGVLLVLAFAAVVIKNQRATQTPNWGRIWGIVKRDPIQLLPVIPYGNLNMAHANYVTNYLYGHDAHPELSSGMITIPVSLKPKQFGETGAYSFQTEKETLMKTNVQAFPWNQIVIDGQEVGPSATEEIGNNLAVRVGAGHHVAQFAFRPPALWRAADLFSLYFFLGWILLLLTLSVWQALKLLTKGAQ